MMDIPSLSREQRRHSQVSYRPGRSLRRLCEDAAKYFVRNRAVMASHYICELHHIQSFGESAVSIFHMQM